MCLSRWSDCCCHWTTMYAMCVWGRDSTMDGKRWDGTQRNGKEKVSLLCFGDTKRNLLLLRTLALSSEVWRGMGPWSDTHLLLEPRQEHQTYLPITFHPDARPPSLGATETYFDRKVGRKQTNSVQNRRTKLRCQNSW